MKPPTYEWKWQRSKKKSLLVLLKNGKKIGCIRVSESSELDDEGEYYRDLFYTAYQGGKRLDTFKEMTPAKIAVEIALGVSTKKSKKKPEPERIK